MEQSRQVFLQTFGCQMNEHDSQQMKSVLQQAGYGLTADKAAAGVIILNTCSVREGPENKLHSYLGRLKEWRLSNQQFVLGVGGCVAQQEKEKIMRRSPWVDLVFGPDNHLELPQMIAKARLGHKVLNVKRFKRVPVADTLGAKLRVNAGRAFISITKGCDNFCSFCIVPFTRGREASRAPESIIAEAEALIRGGAKELMLVGQNVNSYSFQGTDFYRLLELTSQLDGLQRLRFISPHPKDWNYELSQLMAREKTICNQLHLPFQSGSSRILKLMRRDHDIESYLTKINDLKRLIPDISLSTDVIVGFPQETVADFKATCELLKEVQFMQVFAFKYSPRPGTKAALMADDVPLPEKKSRLAELFAIQQKIVAKKLQAQVGKELKVLLDGKFDPLSGQASGKTEANVTVKLTLKKPAPGALVKARIISAGNTSLEAIVQDEPTPAAEPLVSSEA